MKILYIHQYFATLDGATGTRSYEFARRLVAAGHEVTVLCGSSQLAGSIKMLNKGAKGIRTGVVDGITVIQVDLNYSNYDSFLKRAIKFLMFSYKTTKIVKVTDYDVLYATSTPLTVAIPGIIMKKLKAKAGKPFILEIRDLWPELPREMKVIQNKWLLGLLGYLEKKSYQYANAGVGLSPGICEGMKRFGTLDDVELIPNGCDNLFFEKSCHSTSNEALDALLNKDKCVVFTGAHGMANGLEVVIQAAQYLQNLGRSDIKIVLIGDGKVKPKLIEMVADLGVNNCFFFDPIPKREIPYVLKRAKAGLMTLQNIKAFYYGTSPNKFFDYIAAGLPVINNYPGWVCDMINDKHCGLVCEPDDAQALGEAIVRLVDLSEGDYNEMSQNAKILAKEFDRDLLAAKFVEKCQHIHASC